MVPKLIGDVEANLHVFLTSALDVSGQPIIRPFYLRE
jgi:hypothetical protein